MKVCVFAGSFDPFTKGHEFVVDKCLEIFDMVIVAIGVNTNKTPMFSLKERKEMIMKNYALNSRVQVEEFNGMLVDFMKEHGATVYVRGVRDVDDYKYETTMERYNRDMFNEMTTIFIPTPKELVHVSSSAMRNILSLNSDISEYVPSAVCDYIKNVIKK